MTVLPMISPFRLRSSITIDSTAEPTPAGPVPKSTAAVPVAAIRWCDTTD
jgi:hypothetical protein